MNNLPPFSQMSKLLLLLIFSLLTLLIPTPLRHPYLYFLFNILVVVLGIESGLLKAITSPHDEKKPYFTTQYFTPPSLHPSIHQGIGTRVLTKTQSIAALASQALAKPIEKSKVVETTLGGIVRVNNKLKKCASRPSIFFIGGLESEQECIKKESKKEEKEEEWMEADEMTKQELFTKAEHFIGNFYRQLKMQREESWQKIHGLYHKHF
ncbi:Cotton fiber expressed protein [Carex littledalei]|uniref:Cotton fiber expressed protein n=1 Tax=Carex littledalei TaxID=544730 RepID=A0A833RQY2_9POAL|nr:Cotton fiber expressed protein [Carex littledalei]